MIDTLLQYGLFLAKAVTVVVAIGAVFVMAAVLARRDRTREGLEVKLTNDRLKGFEHLLRRAVLPKKQFKAHEKTRKRAEKSRAKDAQDSGRRRLFVLSFRGDLKASAVNSLREEITALLTMVQPTDEVLLRLENAGGLVYEHGLAASQLLRLRQRSIRLVVAVDKIAASGGYMMACVADRVIAAPFAVLGSIGVLLQLPNFNRLLRSHGIDFELVKGGEYKRTLTLFGENSDADREKAREDVRDIHGLFKSFVAEYRPQLAVDEVATGEHWYGIRALERNLCDEIQTSDDYILEASREADVYEVNFLVKKSLGRRFATAVEATVERVSAGWWQRRNDAHYCA